MKRGSGWWTFGGESGSTNTRPTLSPNYNCPPELPWYWDSTPVEECMSASSSKTPTHRLWSSSFIVWWERWIGKEWTGGRTLSCWWTMHLTILVEPHSNCLRSWGSRSSSLGLTAMMQVLASCSLPASNRRTSTPERWKLVKRKLLFALIFLQLIWIGTWVGGPEVPGNTFEPQEIVLAPLRHACIWLPPLQATLKPCNFPAQAKWLVVSGFSEVNLIGAKTFYPGFTPTI